MSQERFDRIENKLDKITDRLSVIEVDIAKQEWKIIKRMSAMFVGFISLLYTLVKWKS